MPHQLAPGVTVFRSSRSFSVIHIFLAISQVITDIKSEKRKKQAV